MKKVFTVERVIRGAVVMAVFALLLCMIGPRKITRPTAHYPQGQAIAAQQASAMEQSEGFVDVQQVQRIAVLLQFSSPGEVEIIDIDTSRAEPMLVLQITREDGDIGRVSLVLRGFEIDRTQNTRMRFKKAAPRIEQPKSRKGEIF